MPVLQTEVLNSMVIYFLIILFRMSEKLNKIIFKDNFGFTSLCVNVCLDLDIHVYSETESRNKIVLVQKYFNLSLDFELSRFTIFEFINVSPSCIFIIKIQDKVNII